MTDRVSTLDDALTLVPDGALLGVGGVLLKRKPVAFLAALAAAGRRNLRAISFLASLEAELLVGSRQEHDIRLIGPPRPDPSWQTKVEGAYDAGRFAVDWEARVARPAHIKHAVVKELVSGSRY